MEKGVRETSPSQHSKKLIKHALHQKQKNTAIAEGNPAPAQKHTLSPNASDIEEGNCETACYRQATMPEVSESVPGCSMKPHEMSLAAAQLEQTKEGYVDLETPDSILVNSSLRSLLTKGTLSSLPPLCQQKLLLLLPDEDREATVNDSVYTLSEVSLHERLAEGEFTLENQEKMEADVEKERSELDPFKSKKEENSPKQAVEPKKRGRPCKSKKEENSPKQAVEPKKRGRPCKLKFLPMSSRTTASSLQSMQKILKQTPPSPTVTRLRAARRRQNDVKQNRHTVEEGNCETACYRQATMPEVSESVPGCSMKPHEMSLAAAQLEQTKEGYVDLETPDSILVNSSLRSLLTKGTLSSLPPLCQQKLLLLLPDEDREATVNDSVYTLSEVSLHKRLAEGEFTLENQEKMEADVEKERSELDPFKSKKEENSPKQAVEPKKRGRPCKLKFLPMSSRTTASSLQSMQKILKQTPPSPTVTRLRAAPRRQNDVKQNRHTVEEGNCETACYRQATMPEVSESVPGCSMKPHEMSLAAAQLEQTKEGYVDLETPDSILVNSSLRSLLTKGTLSSLPPLCQQKLLLLLPDEDREATVNDSVYTLSEVSLHERLAEGEFTLENQEKMEADVEKERSELDPFKSKKEENSPKQAVEPKKRGRPCKLKFLPMSSRTTASSLQSMQKILKQTPPSPTVTRLRAAPRRQNDVKQNRHTVEEGNCETACYRQATMPEVSESVPGCSMKPHEMSLAAAQLEQTKEGYVDLETPDSILVNSSLRSLLTKGTLSSLPPLCQQKLLLLLPDEDREATVNDSVYTLSEVSLHERLAEGEFTLENQEKMEADVEKERSELDPFKSKKEENSPKQAVEPKKRGRPCKLKFLPMSSRTTASSLQSKQKILKQTPPSPTVTRLRAAPRRQNDVKQNRHTVTLTPEPVSSTATEAGSETVEVVPPTTTASLPPLTASAPPPPTEGSSSAHIMATAEPEPKKSVNRSTRQRKKTVRKNMVTECEVHDKMLNHSHQESNEIEKEGTKMVLNKPLSTENTLCFSEEVVKEPQVIVKRKRGRPRKVTSKVEMVESNLETKTKVNPKSCPPRSKTLGEKRPHPVTSNSAKRNKQKKGARNRNSSSESNNIIESKYRKNKSEVNNDGSSSPTLFDKTGSDTFIEPVPGPSHCFTNSIPLSSIIGENIAPKPSVKQNTEIQTDQLNQRRQLRPRSVDYYLKKLRGHHNLNLKTFRYIKKEIDELRCIKEDISAELTNYLNQCDEDN